jgi:hypothetical protein
MKNLLVAALFIFSGSVLACSPLTQGGQNPGPGGSSCKVEPAQETKLVECPTLPEGDPGNGIDFDAITKDSPILACLSHRC